MTPGAIYASVNAADAIGETGSRSTITGYCSQTTTGTLTPGLVTLRVDMISVVEADDLCIFGLGGATAGFLEAEEIE